MVAPLKRQTISPLYLWGSLVCSCVCTRSHTHLHTVPGSEQVREPGAERYLLQEAWDCEEA
jgi:hypothetical protein